MKTCQTTTNSLSLLAYSGMRIGEVVSLQWKDLDFQNSSLSITKTYYNPSNNKLSLNWKHLKQGAP
ncbi:tyrosine-type recombinase/integrase [Bacillus halotolerans]|uniref:tyrosine-type recombinase/integrase n=1 Tax=Bacillus halotolerans TaxID=260554 RepID=UPI00403F78A0